MTATEVGAMGSLIVQIASKIQELGSNWYMASAEWEDFPRKVKLLSRKSDFWQSEVSKFGMLSDEALTENLREAQSLLASEQAKLLKRQAKRKSTCYPKLSMTVFPAKVGLSIQRAINAFDAIPDFLILEEESHTILLKRLLRKPSSLVICDDAHNRYVHLEVSESDIHSALNDLDGFIVVVLCGGAGKGKSTLARHIALHYHKLSRFDNVVYLECGPKVETLSKQMKLLQFLGWDTTPLLSQGQPDYSWSVSKLLEGTLKFRNILMIFDDLWDSEFLQEIVPLCGNGVKCMVTTQNENLCEGLNFSATPIKIQVEREDSRKMLASHAGFSNQLIPTHLEGAANRIIQEIEGNPLALALIATGIDSKRSNELEEWEAASSNFYQLLHSECTAHVLGAKYSKSFFSAMQLSIQPLTSDAQKLLVLVHLCDGPSVPEEVVQVLYRSCKFQEGSTTFEKLRKELESRELLKISDECLDYDEQGRKHRSWSIHSLQKLFIEDQMRDLKESMLTSLARLFDNLENAPRAGPEIISTIPVNEDAMIPIALCALYLHSHFAEKTASKMKISMHRFDDLRRSATEPIVRLLGQPVSDRWPTAAQSSTKLVFLTYIYNGRLHDESISYLLSLPISRLPMLNALYALVPLEKAILLEGNTYGFMEALIHLLEDHGTHHSVKYAAAKAICKLSVRDEVQYKFILISSGAHYKAIKFLALASGVHPGLQVAPAWQKLFRQVYLRMKYSEEKSGEGRGLIRLTLTWVVQAGVFVS